MSAVHEKNEIRTQILFHSRKLFEKGGFRSFSYKDLSNLIGIKTSSIHYYFPSKQDLAYALATNYKDELTDKWLHIDRSSSDNKSKINNYIDIYIEYYKSARNIFLDTMMVTSFDSLDTNVRDMISEIFRESAVFLGKILNKAREKKQIDFEEDPYDLAYIVISMLEGAAVLSVATGNDLIIDKVKLFILKYIESRGKGFISKYLSITR